MQEFFFPIREELKRGLRVDANNERNSKALITCTNVRPRPWGLSAHKAFSSPYSYVVGTWPFPQALKGRVNRFACEETAVYKINTNNSLTPVVTYTPTALSTPKAITSGGGWELVDFAVSTWFLNNGNTLVCQSRYHDYYADSDAVSITTPRMNSICALGDRLVMGGVTIPVTVGTLWQEAWDIWRRMHSVTTTYINHQMGKDFIIIGSVGGGDVSYPGVLELALIDALPATDLEYLKNLVRTMVETGEIAFGHIPVGTIYKILPMGNGLVVYGDSGVAYADVQGPNVAYRILTDVGVSARCTAAGTNRAHAFLSSDGTLYTIGPDLSITEQGYTEFLSTIASSSPILSYDDDEKEWWICNNTAGYVFSANGLSKSTLRPSSVYTGGYAVVAGSGQTAVSIKTDAFDMGNRGIKMVQAVEVGAADMTDISVVVDFKISGDTYKTRTAKCNSQGIAFIGVCGTDFRVGVTGTRGTNGRIDYLNVRWKQSDKRFLRGPYATQPEQ